MCVCLCQDGTWSGRGLFYPNPNDMKEQCPSSVHITMYLYIDALGNRNYAKSG